MQAVDMTVIHNSCQNLLDHSSELKTANNISVSYRIDSKKRKF